jgi:hypothetical protein
VIEVRIPIPLAEYFQVRDDLEDKFNEHAIPIWLSADSVIRTWAGLTFYEWFEGQNADVDQHIAWGEIKGEWDEDMNAAVSHDFVCDGYQPYVVMMFHEHDLDAEYTKEQSALAVLFKLTFGGK